MDWHHKLDFDYGEQGDELLRQALADGLDPNLRSEAEETLLHVAARRRRLPAVELLIKHGAYLDAKNAHDKTAYAQSIRRSFDEIAQALAEAGADTAISEADQLAVAIVSGQLDDARAMIAEHPERVRTGNPEEDRLLADVAGRFRVEPVKLLIDSGADLAAPAMDDGSPLHQAAWFGQPRNARLLVDAGAPLDVFDRVHDSSPIGWAVHGSRYSGGAEQRQDAYIQLVQLLLDVGSSLHYPDEPESPAYLERLRNDAPPWILPLLPEL